MTTFNEVMQCLDNLSIDLVRHVVSSRKTPADAIKECATKPWVLYSIPVDDANMMIPRDGDIVVGFYATGDVKFDIRIFEHGDTIQSHKLSAGAFAYAIRDCLPIPLINMYLASVHMHVTQGNPNDIHMIYASFDNPTRYFMATHTFSGKIADNEYVLFGSGYHSIYIKPNPPSFGTVEWMPWRLLPKPYV